MRLAAPISAIFFSAVAVVSAQTVNFDSPNDLSNNFVINGGVGNFAQVASGGITGGAVNVLTNNASDTAIYKTAMPSAVGQTVSTSIFFKYNRAIRDYNNFRFPISVGFATSTSVSTSPSAPYLGLDAGAHIQELNDGSGNMFVVCHVGFNTQNATPFFNDLLDGHWYRFTLDLTITGNSFSALNFKTYLQDYGSDGQTPAALRIVGSATVNSASVTQATQLFAGFYSQKDGGANLLDNFNVMAGASPPMGGDIALALSADKDPVPVGSNVTYTATINNNGPSDSADVRLNATLPAGESFQSIACDGSCISNIVNNSIASSLGTVPAGMIRHVYITAKVQTTGPLTVTGSAASTSTEDDNPQNNSSSFTTTGVAASPTPTPSPSPTPTATATATPTATPRPTPTASPTPTPAQFLNVATRLRVLTGDNVLIGGFIITGSEVKKIIIRGIGPSLTSNGQPIAGRLTDPQLLLYAQGSSTPIATNDNWKTSDQTGVSQEAAIRATTIPPTNDLESAILVTLSPGAYTVILQGTNGGIGIGVVEVYDLAQGAQSQLANISTRGFVDGGDNVMIGGFILGGGSGNPFVVIRAIGPSLAPLIANPLQDPTLELYDGNGSLVVFNDDWDSDGNNQRVQNAGLTPKDFRESLISRMLVPGAYTAIIRGKNRATGVALVEAYNLQ